MSNLIGPDSISLVQRSVIRDGSWMNEFCQLGGKSRLEQGKRPKLTCEVSSNGLENPACRRELTGRPAIGDPIKAVRRFKGRSAPVGPAASHAQGPGQTLSSRRRRLCTRGCNSPRLRQNNPSGKISLNPSGKSPLQIRPSHPARGAYHDRHETRDGMWWTRQRRACVVRSQGGFP